MPERAKQKHTDTQACTQAIIDLIGPQRRVAAPLGQGKPHALLNALYAKVAADASLSMTLYTALPLIRPQPRAGLEKRFLAPFLERHVGADLVDPQYALDQQRDALPANAAVHEFYLRFGALLRSDEAEQGYISQNNTHVARDLVPKK